MKKFILALVALVGLSGAFAVAANYQMTQGAGTTFASALISSVNYVQMIICDATVGATQCATVTPANAVKVDGSAVTQPVSMNATPSLANGNGVVPTQGGSVLSATNGAYFNLLLGNSASATGAGATGATTQRVGVAQDTTTIAGAAPGTAGTPSANVVSIQGVASGTVVPISGAVNSAINVTATDCSGTVTVGGTAQNAFTAQTTLHGFTIYNLSTSEPLWISFTTTAAAAGSGSYPLPAGTASTYAGAGSFTTPPGFGLNHALSVYGATTSHPWSCTWW
jgi:hypothetical protein